jgi:hypothetical protein
MQIINSFKQTTSVNRKDKGRTLILILSQFHRASRNASRPSRSILLMNTITGVLRMAHTSINLRVCASTPFTAVHYHDYRIHSRQRAVSIFRKIFVAGRIENVNELITILKSHYRSSHRNTSLLLNLHKVARGGLFDFVALHRSRHLDSSPKKQEFSVKVVFPASG